MYLNYVCVCVFVFFFSVWALITHIRIQRMYDNRVDVEQFRFHENSGYARNDQLACNSPKNDNAHMCTYIIYNNITDKAVRNVCEPDRNIDGRQNCERNRKRFDGKI